MADTTVHGVIGANAPTFIDFDVTNSTWDGESEMEFNIKVSLDSIADNRLTSNVAGSDTHEMN